jgi:hypothetical protein
MATVTVAETTRRLEVVGQTGIRPRTASATRRDEQHLSDVDEIRVRKAVNLPYLAAIVVKPDARPLTASAQLTFCNPPEIVALDHGILMVPHRRYPRRRWPSGRRNPKEIKIFRGIAKTGRPVRESVAPVDV